MSTIVKDSEANPSTAEAQSARPGAANNEVAAKPQPVALEVSVTVNGARTVDGSDKREPFSESTKTVLVFGNGAVIRLQSSVAAGQLLFLTNEKTKKEVVCQVVKSKNYRNVSGYVELEFTEPVVGFWGMRFPGDRIAPAAPAAGSPAAPVAANPSATISAPQNKIPSVTPVAPAVVAKPVVAAPIAPVKSPEVAPSAAVHNVAPVLPFVSKSDTTSSSTTSSSALPSASVLTLPRASQPKTSSPQIVATPLPVAPAVLLAPSSAVHPLPTPAAERVSGEKTSTDSSADALRAENARLQEQLSALLFPGSRKATDQASPVAREESKPVDAASKIFDLAHANVAPAVPVKPQTVQTNASLIAPPAPASLAPALPELAPVVSKTVATSKIAEVPLKSLLDDDEVKVPSWLEPLARNAAIFAPVHEHAVELPTPHVADEALQVVTPVAEVDATSDDFSNVPAPTFGSRLLMDENSAGTESASGSKKFLLIGLIAAGLVAAAGGYWYTHQGPTAPVAPASASAATSAATQNVEAASTVASLPNAAQTPRVPQTATSRPGAIIDQAATPAPVNASLAVNPSRAATTTPAQISPAAAAVPPPVAPVKRAALGDVHLAAPNVSRKDDGSSLNEAEPVIGLNGGSESVSLGAGFSTSSGPSAPVAPVPVGGVVKTAQLLTSTRPIYPAFAKTQRVSGDVKIDALIDASGRVTTMKVVSGPAMLHQAAMDALHLWKYQPATLDGKAVPIHLTVTIQFRMQ
jgi:periplasmic protein TonB